MIHSWVASQYEYNSLISIIWLLARIILHDINCILLQMSYFSGIFSIICVTVINDPETEGNQYVGIAGGCQVIWIKFDSRLLTGDSWYDRAFEPLVCFKYIYI